MMTVQTCVSRSSLSTNAAPPEGSSTWASQLRPVRVARVHTVQIPGWSTHRPLPGKSSAHEDKSWQGSNSNMSIFLLCEFGVSLFASYGFLLHWGEQMQPQPMFSTCQLSILLSCSTQDRQIARAWRRFANDIMI